MLGYMISGSVAFGCPGQFAGMLCPAPLIPGSKSGVVTYFAISLPLVICGKLVKGARNYLGRFGRGVIGVTRGRGHDHRWIRG